MLLGGLFTGAFTWGGYTLHSATPGSNISMLANASQQTNSNVTSDNAQQDISNADGEYDESTPSTSDSEEDDQFEGVGEEGLYGCLPEGTTEFVGDMEGYPIEFIITKGADMGNITAIYKNVKYGTIMNLAGESLPADGGNISFFGKDATGDWSFELSGDCENVTGTAQSGDSKLDLTLHKK